MAAASSVTVVRGYRFAWQPQPNNGETCQFMFTVVKRYREKHRERDGGRKRDRERKKRERGGRGEKWRKTETGREIEGEEGGIE